MTIYFFTHWRSRIKVTLASQVIDLDAAPNISQISFLHGASVANYFHIIHPLHIQCHQILLGTGLRHASGEPIHLAHCNTSTWTHYAAHMPYAYLESARFGVCGVSLLPVRFHASRELLTYQHLLCQCRFLLGLRER